MPRTILLLMLAATLGGCTFEVPEFLGREGSGGDSYDFRPEVLPDPVPVQVTSAVVDRGLRGVIVRADGLAPTQGFHTAQLRNIAPTPAEAGDDPSSGIIELEFVAIPPEAAQPVGPIEGRVLHGALFLPTPHLRKAKAVRIHSGGPARTLSLD